VITLGAVAAAIDAQLRGGEAATSIEGVATLQCARAGQISFLANPRYRRYLETTQAGAVIVAPRDADYCRAPVLIVANPLVAYARVAALFAPPLPPYRGIHPSAWIGAGARIAASAWIGPQCSIEEAAVIEEDVFVGPNCVIGARAVVGAHSRLVAQVTLCHDVRLGKRVLVHPGAVIGSDGFGLANDDGRWLKIPQLGSVEIGDDVEIGANTSIDRGALEDTIIEQGVKLDNQIQIAHNVRIGAHSALAGCVGIAGSAHIGRHCVLGGGVGVAGHLQITDHVQITGMSLVTQSLTEPGIYSSSLPVEPHRRWNKISARLRQLDDLARRLFALEKKAFSSGPAD
jgi:UDP-3-O-[3-hydroxymyristoyl] glucosamine N-acyltransferase